MSPVEARLGGTELPREQRRALGKARRLQYLGLAYMVTCVTVVFVVMGSSQAMKAAWVEDLLSFVPPLAFLYATRRSSREPTRDHPYGHHRMVASAHLAAAVALLAMGLFLIYDSGSGLLTQEHPPIGTFNLFGATVWAGWLMIAAMVYTGIGPVILGRLKLPLSEQLHDKVLYADADMNKADWQTAAAAILGILGIGLGLWWADGVAALVIAASIVWDGVTQTRQALSDLMDTEARTYDGKSVHPLVDAALTVANGPRWVDRAAVRVRDQGHVFHTEVFVVPTDDAPTVAQLEDLESQVRALDWKFRDVVVAPVRELPPAVRRHPIAQDGQG